MLPSPTGQSASGRDRALGSRECSAAVRSQKRSFATVELTAYGCSWYVSGVFSRTYRNLIQRPRLRWVVLWTLLVGCGPAFYTVHIVPAARLVKQAEEVDAAEHAPYEYFYAREHLRQARWEAGEGQYQDAIRHAKVAEEFGAKARDLAKRRLRELGR